jgi:hypothetical protein
MGMWLPSTKLKYIRGEFSAYIYYICPYFENMAVGDDWEMVLCLNQ